MKIKITKKDIERMIFILLIIGLVIYGLWYNEAAATLIRAVTEAFSILFQ